MSKLRDFNLLKVADVSSNSTTNNNVSVVVNADSSGNSQTTDNNQNNQNINFIPPTLTNNSAQTQAPIFPAQIQQLEPTQVVYPSPSNLTVQQVQELEFRLSNCENELRFYKLLSSTLSNILKDNNPKLIINLIDQSGKIIIEGEILIQLIAIKTNTDPNLVNIQYRDEDVGCVPKISPIKVISNIKINNETFSLKYNREYNILQDDFNISLGKCIIPISAQFRH